MSLFADDAKLIRKVRTEEDCEELQKDLLLLLLSSTTEKAAWDERKRYKLPDDNSQAP